MKVDAGRKEIMEALNVVMKGVGNSKISAILSGILITCSDNEMELVSNNHKIGISHIVEDVDILEDGVVLVDGRLFSNVIKMMGESISLEISKNMLLIQSGSSKMKLPVMKHSDFPSLKLDEFEKTAPITLNQNLLRNCIKKSSFCADTSGFNQKYDCVYVDIKEKRLNVVATDGHILSVITGKTLEMIDEFNAVIKPKISEIIAMILKDNAPVFIYKSGTKLMFETEYCKIATATLDYDVINYGQFVKQDHENEIEIDTNEAISVFERCMPIKDDNSPILLTIENDEIKVEYKTTNGVYSGSIDVDYAGIRVDINFNPTFLYETFKRMDEDTVTFKFDNSISPIVLTKDNLFYLIAPVSKE